MKPAALFLSVILPLAANTARADIFRWDSGQVIPGTERITPGPGRAPSTGVRIYVPFLSF
jgi:hypothetical protein